MRAPVGFLIFLAAALIGLSAFGQSSGNFRQRVISVIPGDSIKLDSLSIIPGSLKIAADSVTITPELYTVNYESGILFWKASPDSIDSLQVKVFYRVFPYSLTATFKRKDYSLLNPSVNKNPFLFVPGKEREDIFKTEGLQKNGSISRGISFGNNQDVVVNSSLNLQLSGKLNDEVEVLAAITDDNIPIQPEGNTQQLQEFDKVYIQLSKQNSRLIAGDFQLNRPESFFMNYFKRAQGGTFSTSLKTKGIQSNSPAEVGFSVSAAVSKGKFSRNIIQGVEGNQGPYRLKGAENELFIIVLAGTERVFIDGELMERGQEYDYIIDYNTSEITFTANRLITKDKRIVVEFQYSERNYARSLLQGSTKYEEGRLKVKINAFSEEDNKNKPLLQDLSLEQKKLLQQIGDNLEDAITPKVDSVAFTTDEVLYERRDTSINGIIITYYKHSVNPETARYRLGFSNVGEGRGDYVLVNSTANGRVFKWIAPVNGLKKGSYEPVVLLITPKQKRMATIGTEYKLNKNGVLITEGAVTKNDINTFSTLDSEDDAGNALKLGYLQKINLKGSTDTSLSLKTIMDYERVDKHFSPIERYRYVEFERDWNRRSPTPFENQHIATAGIRLESIKSGFLAYNASTFIEEKDIYNGLKHQLNSALTFKKLDITADGSILNAEDSISNSTFIRHRASVSIPVNIFTVGAIEQEEKNSFINHTTDSLLFNSFRFNEWQVFAKTADTLKNSIGVNYTERTDFMPLATAFKRATLGRSVNITSTISAHANHQVKLNSTYRDLDIIDTLLTTQKKDNSILSRVEYNFKLLKGAISSTLFYEIGSGLEVKKEFSYLQVAAGQGTYTWSDYNENGVKELNEFEIAVYQDQANYIKVFTPTNVYVKAYSNQFNQIVLLDPALLFTSKTGLKKTLSLFTNQAAYRVDRKTNNEDVLIAYNPFVRETLDSNMVSLSSSFRNTLSFNRSGQIFGTDFNYQDNRTKTLLINGFDSRINNVRGILIRWNVLRNISLNSTFNKGRKQSDSDYMRSRKYHIIYYEAEPKVSFQPNPNFRLTFNYRYVDKKNDLGEEGITAFFNSIGTEVKYNVLSKGNLQGRVNAISIKYNGQTNSPLAFEMLEGLKPGLNFTWNLSYQRNLSNNMQVSLNYDGRKSENIKTIHTGGVQVRAYF